MTNEEGDVICEVTFIETIDQRRVKIRLGAPILDQQKEWYCCYTEIIGLDGEGCKIICGGNTFQALSLSLERFRVAFENQPGDFRDLNGDAPHMHFPKQIPWVYGSDVYERLCKMVDDEVQDIEDERTRRREARERGEDP